MGTEDDTRPALLVLDGNTVRSGRASVGYVVRRVAYADLETVYAPQAEPTTTRRPQGNRHARRAAAAKSRRGQR